MEVLSPSYRPAHAPAHRAGARPCPDAQPAGAAPTSPDASPRVDARPGRAAEPSRAVALELATRRAEIARLQAELEWLRAERDALAWVVGHDELTGLANRRLFGTLGPRLLAHGDPIAVIVVDLNAFKPVNDTFGHAAGDEVLRAVARRLARWGGGDLVARIGGDEFAGVLTSRDPGAPVDGWRLAATVLSSAISEPIPVLDRWLRMTAAIGIAPAEDGVPWGELLRRADLAMYRAKAARRRYALWDEACEPPCLEFAVFAPAHTAGDGPPEPIVWRGRSPST